MQICKRRPLFFRPLLLLETLRLHLVIPSESTSLTVVLALALMASACNGMISADAGYMYCTTILFTTFRAHDQHIGQPDGIGFLLLGQLIAFLP